MPDAPGARSERVRLPLGSAERERAERGDFVRIDLPAPIVVAPVGEVASVLVGRVAAHGEGDDGWRAYANVCRHQAIPLDARGDESPMSDDGRFLLCRSHGAAYRPRDGACVIGPCLGDRLARIPVSVVEGARGLEARLEVETAQPPVDSWHHAGMANLDPALLSELLDLRSDIDEALERGLIGRQNLAEVLLTMLPGIAERLGAKGAWVQTYGEDLELHVFSWPESLSIDPSVLERSSAARREKVTLPAGSDVIVAQPLDVAGEWFGSAGLVLPKGSRFGESPDGVRPLLELACEELDNYLFSIKAAREKHNLMMDLGQALRHRVLTEGLRRAVEVLGHAIPLDRMLIVYMAEENADATLHVQLYEDGKLTLDSLKLSEPERERLVTQARTCLLAQSSALVECFGFRGAQEEALINGVTKSVVIGKVIASAKSGPFNTYARELLGAFAGFIRQRVVDFNKEWRRLAASFSEECVARLLESDDYEQRYLTPREAEVAILYCDIAGFTKLSEQVLKTPSAVAHLVEEWSREAVDLVWKHGGVFDKMVGDCIIALFGPPFYEDTPGERLAEALRCATAIRDMTSSLPSRPGFEALRDVGLGVSTGVNLAPLFVGTFGPNSNFTGFSSGMNNTARLQGCATRDQILVMEEAVHKLGEGHGFRFGEPDSAAVKNVAQPLRFRPLLG